jgi:sulfonate transport system permease protein
MIMRRSHSRPPANWEGIAVIVALVALWELAFRTRLIDYDYLSAPSEIAAALAELARSGDLAARVGHTTSIAVRASAVACVVGVVGGVVLARVDVAREYSMASIDFFRTIPVLALFPVAVLLWGPSGTSEIAVATYSATWPILLSTADGVRAVPPRLNDVGRVLQLSRRDMFVKIVMPAALVPILVGLRLAVVTALIVTMVAEMIISPRGIGWGLVEASYALRPERMWAYAVTAGLLGYLANIVLLAIVRRAMPGSDAARGGGR